MQSLRHIRRRIRSTENTKKMTRAMEMVAAAKLKKLQDLLKQSDRYIGELRRILETLVREKPLAHALLEKRAECKSTLAFLIASDTGLCGSYNTNVIEKANEFLKSTPSPSPLPLRGGEDKSEGVSIHFVAIGRRAAHFLKRTEQTVIKEFPVPKPNEIDGAVKEVAEMATAEFKERIADRVVFIYTKVESLGFLKPTVAQLFPIVSQESQSESEMALGSATPIDYLTEPSLDEILEVMLPEFIDAETGQFVKHSLVAEQVSRMLAMRQATDNAEEMIESLTLLRNKARQAAITKELIEVVSSSRALQMK